MLKTTVAAVALLAGIAAAPRAQAEWYVVNLNCVTLETFQRLATGGRVYAHTPAELAALGVASDATRSAEAAANLRVLNFGGPHGYVLFTTDRAACLDQVKNHPSPADTID